MHYTVEFIMICERESESEYIKDNHICEIAYRFLKNIN